MSASQGAESPRDVSEPDLLRQRERTVDNLKPLFAFIFAISFTVLGTGAFQKLTPLLTIAHTVSPSLAAWIINVEMLGLFVVTAGVFFHQGAKFLDHRYARQPLSQVHPLGFAWDYLTLVVTMVPFFFMAQSYGPSITHYVGYTWFFASYVGLLGSGLVLLVLAQISPRCLQRADSAGRVSHRPSPIVGCEPGPSHRRE